MGLLQPLLAAITQVIRYVQSNQKLSEVIYITLSEICTRLQVTFTRQFNAKKKRSLLQLKLSNQ
jgi:hypothetical protein